MKKLLYIPILLLLLSSCQDVKKSEKPKDLIPEEQMVNILAEISLLNSARNFNKRLFESTGMKPEAYIYEKFGIDSLQLEKSNRYYAEHYTQYELIYKKVREKMEGMKVTLDSIREEEIRIQDSINQARQDSIARDSIIKDSLKMVDPVGNHTLTRDSIRNGGPVLDSLRQADSVRIPPVPPRAEVGRDSLVGPRQ